MGGRRGRRFWRGVRIDGGAVSGYRLRRGGKWGDDGGLHWLSDGGCAVVAADLLFESLQLLRVDVEDPLEIRTHLALHLVDFSK
jgi:hypothetical protein